MTDDRVDDPVEWLYEQIAEAERVAREANVKQNDSAWNSFGVALDDEADTTGILDGEAAAKHIALHDPRDALAQCESHRLIVDDYAALRANTDRHTDAALHLQYNVLQQVVRVVAWGYRHRPGYREEWRP